MSWSLIHSSEPEEWAQTLVNCGEHDAYHLLGYQKVQTDRGSGRPHLFRHQYQGTLSALPVLIRPIPAGAGRYDAISAYGTPGAISAASFDPRVRASFSSELKAAMRELDVVSLLVRQHPLTPTDWLFDPKDVRKIGRTVAIDLTLTEDQIRAQSNSNHRRNLSRADEAGFDLVVDHEMAHHSEFSRLYAATMTRLHASESHGIAHDYALRLKEAIGPATLLMHARLRSEIQASILLLHHGEKVNYHLGGASEVGRKQGAMRWLLESARRWAKDNGAHVFHLGGGVGGADDSLLSFKSGFSKSFADYSIVTSVIDEAEYGRLVRESGRDSTDDYFPRYRSAGGGDGSIKTPPDPEESC